MPTPARSRDPRFHDFDADFAEQETIPFKLLGKVWELPGAVPATVILRVQRLQLALTQMLATGDVPDDLVVDEELSYESMCRQMVGDDLVDEWLKKRISYDMLTAVTRRLYAIYTGGDPDEDQESGKAPAKQPTDRKPPAKRSPRKR